MEKRNAHLALAVEEEAMLNRAMSVVATKTPAIREVVTHGVESWLSTPLTPGPGGKMLGEMIQRLKQIPPSQRVVWADKWLKEIQTNATHGVWKAERLPMAHGASGWAGEYHVIVIDAQGNIYKGLNPDLGWAGKGVDTKVSDWTKLSLIK